MCWIDTLREQCLSRQIQVVAAELGYSRTAVSKVINGKYPGNTKHIQAAVERAYPANTVSCPVFGELARDKCLFHQSQPLRATTGVRVLLYRSCKICPHNCHKEAAYATTQ
ncbi:hypothetical protein ACW5XW_02805 [Aeromonas piscicola]|uniref:hypothetical protein n=1 Tax=Aeromonas piscicola TaxID=600645 RepID=UPI0005B4A164|nr:hypothetical protein [Aeromonas piscicola]